MFLKILEPCDFSRGRFRGFRLSVKGQENEILLDKESILDVKYISETPDDSNARVNIRQNQ